MSATCDECEPYLTDDQIDDAELIFEIMPKENHCVGCDFIKIKMQIDKDNNLLN